LKSTLNTALTTPKQLGYRMPAEWERHVSTWFTWPRPEGISFPGKYETVPPVYGITHNIYSHNPKDVLLHEYKNVFSGVSKVKGLKNKISFLFTKPGSAITDVKKDDSNKLKEQTTIFYTPLNKAI